MRLCASHGFAVSTLMESINHAELPIELRYQNSMESIAALAQDDCEIAGFPFARRAYMKTVFCNCICASCHLKTIV